MCWCSPQPCHADVIRIAIEISHYYYPNHNDSHGIDNGNNLDASHLSSQSPSNSQYVFYHCSEEELTKAVEIYLRNKDSQSVKARRR